MTLNLRKSKAVQAAEQAGIPLVALESTIITHGMPYPTNLETARSVEDKVREGGACPATIAVLDGHINVGLDPEQLESLSKADAAMKLSRADLPLALATGRTGSTTVAATMIAAHLAGIEVFATGGIGGVHQGAETSFDVSADLQELATTPVTVVAAGAKAILDLPKTLEVLETFGVPVICYQSDDFPAFWSCSSGLPAPLRLDDPKEIATAQIMRTQMGLKGGQLIANPIHIKDQIPADILDPIIADANDLAAKNGISGKALTPFLLDQIYHLTDGRSLEANISLVLNNAALASKLACAFKELKTKNGLL